MLPERFKIVNQPRAFNGHVLYHHTYTAKHETRGGYVIEVFHALEAPSDYQFLRHIRNLSQPLDTQTVDLEAKKDGVFSPYGRPIEVKTPKTPELQDAGVDPCRAVYLHHVDEGEDDFEASKFIGDSKHPLCIAYDAEWQEKTQKKKGNDRDIITHQFAFRDHNFVLHFAIVKYPAAVRVSLQTILSYLMLDWVDLGFLKNAFKSKASVDAYRQMSKKEKRKVECPYLYLELIGHYNLVDMTAFYRGKDLLRETDTVRRTQVSIKPFFRDAYDESRHKIIPIVAKARDTQLIAPANAQSLAKLGDALGFEKLKLADGVISRMRDYYKADFDGYFCYSIRDAHVTLLWKEAMSGENVPTPLTTGTSAAHELRNCMCEARGWDVDEFDREWRGWDVVIEDKRKVKFERPEAATIQAAATQAYIGGRNECFLHGIIMAAIYGWSDFDLSGAYPTAQVLIPDIDFDGPRGMLSGQIIRGQITPLLITFPRVRFEFPPETQYPCLPVADPGGRGLVFPLKGECYASAPELYLALELGAKIETLEPAQIVPSKPYNTLGEGVKGMVQARAEAKAKYGKGSPQESNAKTKVVSAYGKTAQGIKRKKAYTTRTNDYQYTPNSVVTNPYAAAMTTSLVRAVVSAAMIELGRLGYKIASVTTDGFLTDAPEHVVKSLKLFGFAGMFEQARMFLSDDPTIWELKHRAQWLVMLKTRGGFGIGELDGAKLPVARAGYRPSTTLMASVKAAEKNGKSASVAMNEQLAIEFLNRTSGQVAFEFHALPSPKDYVRKDADGVGKDLRKSANWEFDLKRKPRTAEAWTGTIEVDNVIYSHLSYETDPWETMDDFYNARAVREATDKAVKSIEDLHDMDARIAFRAAKPVATRISKNGIAHTKALHIMRAVRAGVLIGPDRNERGSGRAFVNSLETHFNIEIKNDAWKNAGRAGQKFTLEGLESDIESLGLRYKDETDDLVITVDSSMVA